MGRSVYFEVEVVNNGDRYAAFVRPADPTASPCAGFGATPAEAAADAIKDAYPVVDTSGTVWYGSHAVAASSDRALGDG